ncbi:hypothetical protein ACS5PN_27000 [Roseateles sp. NT4]|uniref:YncE family protein n=1 Tax=Roseateles sp. NT4 TaxID=3453715 RepID=UPI003EEBB124
MRHALHAVLITALVCGTAVAQTVAIGLDAKARLEDGELVMVPNPPVDTTAFYRFSNGKPMLLGRVPAPISFQGSPRSIVISTQAEMAISVSSRRLNPERPSELVPDNRLTVFDLAASPPRVLQTLELSATPTSIALSPDGKLAVVTHVNEDKLSLVAINGNRVEVIQVISLETGSGPMGAALNPVDGSLLVTLAKAGRVVLFKRDGQTLKQPAEREMTAGIWPASLSFCGRTGLVVVANYGRVRGDRDTISLIDTATPARVVDTVSVGSSPEGIACSQDGLYAAAAIQNMSTTQRADPLYSTHSKAVLIAIERRRLRVLDEVDIGGWAQGVDFLEDNRTLFAESMNDSALHLFKIKNAKLVRHGAPLVFEGGAPAAYGVSSR